MCVHWIMPWNVHSEMMLAWHHSDRKGNGCVAMFVNMKTWSVWFFLSVACVVCPEFNESPGTWYCIELHVSESTGCTELLCQLPGPQNPSTELHKSSHSWISISHPESNSVCLVFLSNSREPASRTLVDTDGKWMACCASCPIMRHAAPFSSSTTRFFNSQVLGLQQGDGNWLLTDLKWQDSLTGI